MKEYLANRWSRIGFWLAVFGWGPLWAIVLLAAIGLWPDPDPNPIGPGPSVDGLRPTPPRDAT